MTTNGPRRQRIDRQGKALLSARGQDYAMVQNAASFCVHSHLNYTVSETAQALAAVTGFAYNVDEITRIGERLWQLKRGLNCLWGASAADDRLPARLLQPLEDGPSAGSVPDMELMLREFYALRGLDGQGRPALDRLEALGLSVLADRLRAVESNSSGGIQEARLDR